MIGVSAIGKTAEPINTISENTNVPADPQKANCAMTNKKLFRSSVPCELIRILHTYMQTYKYT